MKKIISIGLIIGFGFLISISCRFSRLENDLSVKHKEFLSEVRYLIKKKEKKVFRKLPPAEREEFIEEFWKKRDPDPATEENEFKDAYYTRIKEANHLFQEGATPGWLQDRGRIYILIGPPEIRNVYPMGYSFYDRPSEVWYYGFFPIIFVDYSYVGNYELLPISAQYVATLMRHQMGLKPDVKMEKVILDFDLNLEKMAGGQVQVKVKIPYKNIWFVEENEKLETTLSLNIEVFSALKKKMKVWDFNEEYLLSLDQSEIRENLDKSYVISAQPELVPGNYTMKVLLENKTDGTKAQKTIKFDL